MNGYAFTRFEANFTSKIKSQSYEAAVVAMQCKQAFERSGEDYREDVDYNDAKFWFYETTGSCNKEEAINWMKYYMANAIAYGIETKNLDWRTKFLAAWDIFLSLTNGKYAMGDTETKLVQGC